MLTNSQIAVAVVVVTVITFVCRIVPFALLRGRQDSALLAFLSRAMPLGVMIVLVAYTLGGVSLSPSSWLPAPAGSGRRRACTCGGAPSGCHSSAAPACTSPSASCWADPPRPVADHVEDDEGHVGDHAQPGADQSQQRGQ